MRHETVDLIFNAAIEVFAESGFDQAKWTTSQGRPGRERNHYYRFRVKRNCSSDLMNEGFKADRSREQYLNCINRRRINCWPWWRIRFIFM